MKNKILFIDWYKTLSFDLFWQKLKNENPLEFRIIETSIFCNEEKMKKWMTGQHSSEEICKDISLLTTFDEQQLFSELQRCCSNMHVHPSIINTIQKLQSQYHVIITTDNMDCFSRFTVPATNIQSWTDAILNSSDTQRLKNDEQGKTFRETSNLLHVPFHQTICIDDTLSTCELIQSLGGKSMQTKNESETLKILESLL